MKIEQIKDSYSLEGKVAIVTGASKPNGMGLATAHKLGELGASLVIAEIATPAPELNLAEGMEVGSAETLKGAVDELKSAGYNVIGQGVDVRDREQVHACVAAAELEFGGVDVMVNNAGVFIGAKGFYDLTDADWENSWQVHVKGIMEFCKAVIPLMQKRGGGAIVNNSSVAGIVGAADYAAYGVTKAGIVSLTQNLAAEFGGDNIRANVICPGNIYTNVSDAERTVLANRYGVSEDEVEEMMTAPVALGRRGTTREIAEVVGFLASPASSYLTGVVVPVTGGLQAGLE